MLNCCYGYSNHGSRKPENPRKFSTRKVTEKIPDPFISFVFQENQNILLGFPRWFFGSVDYFPKAAAKSLQNCAMLRGALPVTRGKSSVTKSPQFAL